MVDKISYYQIRFPSKAHFAREATGHTCLRMSADIVCVLLSLVGVPVLNCRSDFGIACRVP